MTSERLTAPPFFFSIFGVRRLASLAMALLLVVRPGLSSEHPNMFLNSADIEGIRSRVATGEEPWASAYEKLLADAGNALAETVRSVVHAGPIARGGSRHDFLTEKPYTVRDGEIDPKVDRSDYEAAIRMSRAVRDLGLAYALTGEKKYAVKGVELIDGWCVNPATRMSPRFTNNQSRIEICITIPGMLYGADLLYNAPEWPESNKEAFLLWVDSLAIDAGRWTANNNFDAWRVVLLATAGALLDREEMLSAAFIRFKENITRMIDSNPRGQLPEEMKRTRSLFYSLYALSAMVQVAEIARRRSAEDLFDYAGANGVGLKDALLYHAPYAAGDLEWPRAQLGGFKGENCSLFELAYSHWKDEAFRSVIEKWRRPMYEERIMGPVTLTHGAP